MRDRKTIESDSEEVRKSGLDIASRAFLNNQLILEVFLDIRELLKPEIVGRDEELT